MSSGPSDILVANPSISSRTGTGTPRQRTYSRQTSEDSARRRPLHPAEKKAAQLRLPPQTSFEKKPNPHHAMQALRRLSRADFSSIRRASTFDL